MIEISGQEKKIEAFIEAVRPYGIMELARTGRIALVRGDRPLEAEGRAGGASRRRAKPGSIVKAIPSFRVEVVVDMIEGGCGRVPAGPASMRLKYHVTDRGDLDQVDPIDQRKR